nr:hypothetical protein BgiMline_014917 [Biomphalaria glabrata]
MQQRSRSPESAQVRRVVAAVLKGSSSFSTKTMHCEQKLLDGLGMTEQGGHLVNQNLCISSVIRWTQVNTGQQILS